MITATAYNSAHQYVPLTTTEDAGTGKLNLVTTYTYDTVGNPTVVDGPRTNIVDITTTAYDNQRRAIQVTDALGKLTKLAYDADGNLIRSSAQIGTQWLVSCNTYTPSDKLLKAWGPGQTAADTTCPTAAAPVAVTDYVYDDQDRFFRITRNLTVAEGGNRVTETTYNLDGSVLNTQRAVGTALVQTYAAYTYTDNGLAATVKDAKNNLTTYQYDGLDRLFKMLYPDKVTAGVSSTTDSRLIRIRPIGRISITMHAIASPQSLAAPAAAASIIRCMNMTTPGA